MAINKIITEKTLNYIETLYLYTNLEEFLDHNSTAYDWLIGEINQNTNKLIWKEDLEDKYSFDKYSMMMDYLYDTLLHSADYLGESSGRMWYKMPNYRLGIMDYDKAKKSNQFNIEIQYEQLHMFTLEPSLNGLDLPFGDDLAKYHIKRVDVSQIVKTPNDYLTNHNFISPYRVDARIKKNGITETMYLGNRKSGNVFRMYNKTKELLTNNKEHPINHKKIDLFSSYFGDIEDLYTFELELHRKYIKRTFDIDTLLDLDKVYKAYHEIVGKIGIYEDNDKNRKHIKNNHRDRIKCLYFTEYKEYKRTTQKRYKTSKYYVIEKAVQYVESYSKAVGNVSYSEKISIIDEISTRILNREVDIHIGSSPYDEMKDKHERIREGQSNDLEIQAYRAFKKVSPPTPTSISQAKGIRFFTESLFE